MPIDRTPNFSEQCDSFDSAFHKKVSQVQDEKWSEQGKESDSAVHC